ncbi:molybdenum cofactor guanylyltransferase [Marinicrinis lubricantis]|uniref:Molybdenum cofactor guanylyltransferase n=1 Tax=Marinicrinis lubricantis TaxID=2086470 RepID=A0ABW1IQB3_9BACL
MLTGVILAGGLPMNSEQVEQAHFQSSALRECIETQVHTMSRLCSEVMVVTDYPIHLVKCFGSQIRIVTDFYQSKGPMSGLHAALSLARHKALWIVDCRLVHISEEAGLYMYRKLLNTGSDAVVPIIKDKPHPLYAVYAKRNVDKLITLIEGGVTRIEEFLHFLKTAYITEEEAEAYHIHFEVTKCLAN